ncbi:MAG: hypothetical protein QOF35_1875 [Actinomycetota bacterium]|nr:hypothetical protein [Actinomycetota bacterium]
MVSQPGTDACEAPAADWTLHPAYRAPQNKAGCRLWKLVWRGHRSILAHIRADAALDSAISGASQGQLRVDPHGERLGHPAGSLT